MKRLTMLVALLPGIGFAADITNNISGVGPNGSVKPFICLKNNDSGKVTKILKPGDSGNANAASGNPYYAGADIRFDGCEGTDSFLGYIGFNIGGDTKSINAYTPPKGDHVIFANPAIDSTGKVTGAIEYTPIGYNPDFTPAKPAKNWQFVGINLSGLEFGKSINPGVIPNLSQADVNGGKSDLKDTEAFIKAGMNTVRIPISWGYLQLGGPGKGPINMAYYNNYLKPLLQTLTHAKVNTIVDLHAYMRYSKFGEQYSGCGPKEAGHPCPDGTLITDANAYKSVWGQLAGLMQNDPSIDKNYLIIDLMNEPVDVPNKLVFTIQAELIKMLRDAKINFTGYILVEGNSWTGLHSWATHQWKGTDGQTYSNATLFTRDNFNNEGLSDKDLEKIIINVHQYLDSDYSGTKDDCQQNLWTTGPEGFNLKDFVDYLEDNKFKAIVTEFGAGTNANSCREPLTEFMRYLQTNSANGKDYGFIGWTIWSTGHGWGDYGLRVMPVLPPDQIDKTDHMGVLKEFL